MNAQVPINAHIESPNTPQVRGTGAILRGWAYSRTSLPILGVRLSWGKDGRIDGLYGLPRPDVLAIFPEAGRAETGWEVRVILPRGRHYLEVEFQTADGEWRRGAVLEIEMYPPLTPRCSPWADGADLLRFQFPAHAAHPPRPVRPEVFPRPRLPLSRLPSLSIVTPSFQQVWALGQCMDSVLSASGLKIEYVVRDGGSTDGSVEQIRARAGRLAAWCSGPDGGQTRAIAEGFAMTTGSPNDLMAWINSDDFYLPGALRFVAEYFANHPEVDVVYGHRVVVNRAGHEVARWFLPPHDPDVLRLNDFVPQETLFWRRRVWERIGGLDCTFHFAMDWDLLLRFQAAGARIVRLPFFLGGFRVHPQQKTMALVATRGRTEIEALRRRSFGRDLTESELISSSILRRYLRHSAALELLWRCRLRRP